MADYDVKVLEISKGGNTYTYDAGGTHYAVCDTAAGTQIKAVTISEIASLTTGLSVRIKFSNAQTYNGQPKLQINSLTATNIVRMGTTAAAQYEWNAGEVLDFVYDGTNFIIQEGAVPTTTYYGSRIKLSSATNSTSEALAATPKAVKAAYDLANGKASTSVASQSANGLMSSTDKTKLDGIATGATANVGTITGINMNGKSKGTSGVVNLGTVLTSHQDISSKANRDEIGIVVTGKTASQNVTSGQYVIVRNSTISGISDGLYMASANVSAGTAFTSANLTAVSNGGLNSLNEQIVNVSGLSGKKILIIGDSISDEALYPNCWVKYFRPMAESVGATVTNYSLQGRTIGIYTNATNYLMNVLTNIPSDTYDEIVVFLGTNDWGNQVSLGNINSSDQNSVGYNIKQFYEWKRTNQSNAKVLFITPLRAQVSNDARHKLLQFYCIAIASAASWCGFNIIDAHSYAPLLTTKNISDWTRDGIHPTDAFGPYLAQFIFKNLLSKTNSVGLNNFKTTLAIGDVGGNATRVKMHYSGDGIVFYDVSNFSVTGIGNIKLADLPEECQTYKPVYGTGLISVSGAVTLVPLFSTGNALYVHKPSGVSDGVFAGSTGPGFVRHLTLTEGTY